MADQWWSKLLRLVGIILMGLTAVFTIMGGAGTSCVAINPAGFGGGFISINPFQWLYILFVVITLAFGVMGVRAVLLLIRNRSNSYRYALIALLGGAVVGVIHMLVSRSLRGSSMPVDMVTYTNIFTLVIFLIFRFPGIWERIGYGQAVQSNDVSMAGGLSVIVGGAICLTIQYWMGPTHTIGGVNYADSWHVVFQVIGLCMVVAGVILLVFSNGLLTRRQSTALMMNRS
jgi:hypothetical protein